METKNQVFATQVMSSVLEKESWKKLSECDNLPWSENLISSYMNWDWESLSDNHYIVWDMGMLNRFKRYLNWKSITRRLISHADLENYNITTLVKMLESFKDKWDWESISEYIDHPQVEVILETFANKLSWQKVAENRNIKWDERLFEKFEERFSELKDIEDTEIWEYLINRRVLELTAEILKIK